MRIAVLGATSQIARDVIAAFAARHELSLFSRRPEEVRAWAASAKLPLVASATYAEFAGGTYDAVLNFVGIGDPARAAAMGAGILQVTDDHDALALAYLRSHPSCRYVFLSSGAAYGTDFEEPAREDTPARIRLNQLGAQDWYSVAKIQAECRHRALQHLPIVDLRVFSYFSHAQDMGARFLLADAMRAIRAGETLRTSGHNVVRDYMGPADFCRLLALVLAAPPCNDVFDCYTRAPVDKMALLAGLQGAFGLRWDIDAAAGLNATGLKPQYYSLNRRAARLGFEPSLGSLETVLQEAATCLGARA